MTDTQSSGKRREALARLLGVGGCLLVPRWGLQQPDRESLKTHVSVKSFGARGDGASDDTEAIVKALLNDTEGNILFPDGAYVVSTPISVDRFSGRILFAPNAVLVFTDTLKDGIHFYHGRGAVVQGFRARWREYPSHRLQHAAGLGFTRAENPTVIGCVIENSPAAGLLFDECMNPVAEDIRVADTLADGIHFANCENARLTRAATQRTGDDGVAFVNYAAKPDLQGAVARQIEVRQSRARGIAVPGHSRVEISDFLVDTTSAPGIYCAYESGYQTRVPGNVVFRRGRVFNAGQLAPRNGNLFGVDVHLARSVRLESVEVRGSLDRGLSILAPLGTIDIANLLVADTHRADGVNITAGSIEIDRLIVDGAPGYGAYFAHCTSVIARNLKVTDVARTHPLRRAVWFDYNGHVEVDGIELLPPVGSGPEVIIGGAGEQTGWIKGVSAGSSNAKLRLDATASPNLRFIPRPVL